MSIALMAVLGLAVAVTGLIRHERAKDLPPSALYLGRRDLAGTWQAPGTAG